MTALPRYLPDTNICIDLLRGRADRVATSTQKHQVDEIVISTITLAELQHGVAQSARPAHHEPLFIQFCTPLAILAFDDRAATMYGRVRTSLERASSPIGPFDTRIAAHALAMDLVQVTNNEREFGRVAGLQIENWLSS